MTGKGAGLGGQNPTTTARKHLIVWVNGKRHIIANVNPRETALNWLRSIGLTGTKNGCSEGGCGACTVVVSRRAQSGHIEHFSVNACLTPICALDSHSITTIEGLGSTSTGLHPIQRSVAEFHGSQCGFCTPGIVMALYALVESGEVRTSLQFSPQMWHSLQDNLEHKMNNLCRCTGYRPILDAAKAFDSAYRPPHCSESYCSDKESVCCSSKEHACCSSKESVCCGDVEDLCVSTCTGSKLIGMTNTESSPKVSKHPAVEFFPQELLTKDIDSPSDDLLMIESDMCTWFRPTSLPLLLALKKEYGHAAKLISGNTEVGIETKFKHQRYEVFIGLSCVDELHELSDAADSIIIGGAVSLSRIDKLVEGSADRGCISIHQMLSWFASRQIRNVASLAGNVATASPISDMNPMLVALDSVVIATSADRGDRDIKIRDFFKAYRTVALAPDEVIRAIRVPKVLSPYEYVSPFKQARRREDDISIVTSGMRVQLKPDSSSSTWVVSGFWISFGGMAAKTIAAHKTETFFVGKEWCRDTLDAAVKVLASETTLPTSVPGGMSEFRSTLCVSFLHKFFFQVTLALAADATSTPGLPPVPLIDSREASAALTYLNSERPQSSGYQRWPRNKALPLDPCLDAKSTRAPVGEPIMHKSAYAQVSGEAKYADDYLPKATDDILHAALVLTTVPRGTLITVDASAALALQGVVGYFAADDVTGCNKIGAVAKDEECFITRNVTSVGQPIGIIIAESREVALDASRLVKVEYEEHEGILSIDDAIAVESYFGEPHDIVSGRTFDEAVADFPTEDVVIVDGETHVGGQEHFYLECNSSICFPLEDRGMKVISSTQNPSKTQAFVASVLGVPANKVSCIVKRLGGGFGGKETRSVFIAAAVAVAADKLQRPIKITLDRDVDMSITGTRHAFKGRYKAACQKSTGLLIAIDLELYANAGYSLDLSQAVVDRALFHCENAYYVPNVRAIGYCCKTNTPSNTAFRGFGGPQGMQVCETYMEHLAAVLKLPVHEFRARNLYRPGLTLTPYHQTVESFVDLPSLWRQAIEESDFMRRRDEVDDFNRENKYKKRGLAILPTKFGISFTSKLLNQGGALVHVYTDGSIRESE